MLFELGRSTTRTRKAQPDIRDQQWRQTSFARDVLCIWVLCATDLVQVIATCDACVTVVDLESSSQWNGRRHAPLPFFLCHFARRRSLQHSQAHLRCFAALLLLAACCLLLGRPLLWRRIICSLLRRPLRSCQSISLNDSLSRRLLRSCQLIICSLSRRPLHGERLRRPL